MTLGSIHGNGTILGSISLAIMAVGQVLAVLIMQRTRQKIDVPLKVDEIEPRNPSEDARTQNIWLFGG
jgi:hypothetical protein